MANGRKNGRLLKDWLTSYLEYTSEQESPSLFHLWVGLSVLAATLERKVWINRGYYTLHPNLYVVLIGASARVRKTSAIKIGFKLYKEAMPDGVVIAQKTTMEAMISVFVQEYKEKGVSGGYIVSDELSVFLGKGPDAVKLVDLLTKIYDCPAVMDYYTMARGREIANNVFCNMIAATTPNWLRDSLPGHSVGGGFTSRVVFCYQVRPEKLVPWPVISPETEALRKKLVVDLKNIAKLGGEYKVSEKAMDWFTDWYTGIFKPEDSAHASLDGYYGRKHDTLLKLALLFAVSNSNTMVINEMEMMMALKALNKNEKFLPQTLRLIQMTEVGEESEKVLRTVTRKREIDHVSLMRALSYCMNAKRLDEVIDELVRSDMIIETIKGNKRWYKKGR